LSAFYFSASKANSKAVIIRRFLTFPPVWAMALAVALRPFHFPQNVEAVLAWGPKTMIPLALISVGAQLKLSRKQFQGELTPLFVGLGYKLVLAPLLMTLFLVGILHQNGEAIRITLLEAAMGPMITGAILADEYELDPPLCSLLVSTGIPICLITVPIWAKCLEWAGI
jgi:predicted permease